MNRGRTPFVAHLQCLVCGTCFWVEADKPKSCPKCKPAHNELTRTAILPVARQVAPQ